jgi:hypothetical protein
MIEADITPTAERDLIINFVTSSKIGVLKGFRKNGNGG